MYVFSRLKPFALVGLFLSCKPPTSSNVSSVSSSNLAQLKYLDRGFNISGNPDQCKKQCRLNIALGTGSGRSSSYSLESTEGASPGKVVYVFPSDVPKRSYDFIEKNMVEYSLVVGTMLHRKPEGEGELEWARVRKARWREIWNNSGATSQEYCNIAISKILEKVSDGSSFLQYGNCGEGGLFGACLAVKAGFSPKFEIRSCSSANDHAFAMVKHQESRHKWCILDRWPIARIGPEGHFSCGVDWDPDNGVVTIDGKASKSKWFQKVTCTSFFDNKGPIQ
jgi:hypothetical protein